MNEKINYDGVKFGMLTILRDGDGLYEGKRKRRSVICKCDCGNDKEILLRQLIKGKQKSCGCLALKRTEFEVGEKISFWTVVRPDAEVYISPKGDKMTTCEVQCVCGKISVVTKQSLKSGCSNSCGCRGIARQEKIKKEKIIPTDTKEEQWKQSINYPEYYISTLGRLFHYESQMYTKTKNIHEIKGKQNIHLKNEMYLTFIGDFDDSYLKVYGGLSLNSLYLHFAPKIRSKYCSIYVLMKYRCNDKNCPSYPTYGAKGIKIEGAFKTLEGFLDWVKDQGIKGDEKLELDRIDSSKGYYPENCQFISKEENILKSLNLSENDVRFIRSDSFDWNLHRDNYNCSDYTLKNIIEYKTFKGVV